MSTVKFFLINLLYSKETYKELKTEETIFECVSPRQTGISAVSICALLADDYLLRNAYIQNSDDLAIATVCFKYFTALFDYK